MSVDVQPWPPIVVEPPDWPHGLDTKEVVDEKRFRLFHWGPIIALSIIGYVSNGVKLLFTKSSDKCSDDAFHDDVVAVYHAGRSHSLLHLHAVELSDPLQYVHGFLHWRRLHFEKLEPSQGEYSFCYLETYFRKNTKTNCSSASRVTATRLRDLITAPSAMPAY